MLNPDNRHLYLEALRPPIGYGFNFGIGTTYSLDLTTLMMVPLATADFTSGENQQILKDRVALLESLQKCANKLLVFCQQGKISIPSNINSLYSFLEDSIVEVTPNKEGKVFHPKIWFLKFTNEHENNKYKLIVLSKNITFDKAWDTILVLEGNSTQSTVKENKPLSDFIKYFPEISVYNLNKDKVAQINNIAEEINYIKFDTPDNFNSNINFYPLGIGGYNLNPFPQNYNRAMVISPFISSNILGSIKDSNNILVSKDDGISQVYDKIKDNFKIYVVNNMIEYLEDENKYEIDSDINVRSGLHTKLFLFEDKDKVEILTGSANATNAAFNGNIEFMVGLQTSKNHLSIENILSDEMDTSFIDLLKEYIHLNEGETDESQVLKNQLEDIKCKILNLDLRLIVHKSNSDNTLYDLEMRTDQDLKNIELESAECWPITRDGNHHSSPLNELAKQGSVTFNSLSLISITRFIAFSIELKSDNLSEKLDFVLNLPIKGIPQNRDDEIIYNIIDNRNKFIKYLIFLLCDSDDYYLENDIRNILNRSTNTKVHQLLNIPLLEEMIKALREEPKRLDAIDRLVRRLKKDDKAQKILPVGFESCWETIMEVRRGDID